MSVGQPGTVIEMIREVNVIQVLTLIKLENAKYIIIIIIRYQLGVGILTTIVCHFNF